MLISSYTKNMLISSSTKRPCWREAPETATLAHTSCLRLGKREQISGVFFATDDLEAHTQSQTKTTAD